MPDSLPFPTSRWEQALLRLASHPLAPLLATRPQRDWPPSPVFTKHRFRRVGRLWVRGRISSTPIVRVIVRETKNGTFAGAYLESAPGQATALLDCVVQDRALLPPFAQPEHWPRLFSMHRAGYALCTREAGWLFVFYLESDGRGIFFSRKTSLNPQRNHPPQIRELRSCRPPTSHRQRKRM